MDKQRVSFTLGNRLEELRKSNGLTHVALAKRLKENYGIEVSRDSLMAYEISSKFRAKASKLPNLGMRVEYLYCLSDFYGVSIDYLLGITDIPNTDTNMQAVHKFTGLSARAIGKLQDIYEENRKTAFSDIVSLLIEDSNSEYFLRIIGEIISCSIEGTSEREVSVDVAGSEMRLPKGKMLKTIFQTSFIDALPRIVAEYVRRFDKTPNQRTEEYFELLLTLKKRKDHGEITHQEFMGMQETWLKGGNP